MQKPTDIIAHFSQGLYPIEGKPQGVGRSACTSICARAIFEILTKGKIDNPDQIYPILKEGINAHISQYPNESIPGAKPFQNALEKLNPALAQKDKNEVKILKTQDGLAGSCSFDENQFVVLTANKTNEDSGETILLFRQGDKFCVFDSHGSKFEGVDRGASVRQFDSVDDLEAFLEQRYPAESYDTMYDLVSQNDAH